MIIAKALFSKIGLPLLIAGGGFFGGMMFQGKVMKPKIEIPACPPCPQVTCNPPAVSVQPFEVEKMKNLRNFTYQPSYSGSISVAGVDSAFVKRAIREAIREELNRKPAPR
jgi:hypothetical protein